MGSELIENLEEQEDGAGTEAFARVIRARHPQRPYSMDLFRHMFRDFVELHGDRRYADDAALICGFARLGETEVAVIGQQKGRDTKQRRVRNFGMPKPEGYRKALRLMNLANKFRRPIITFIDTPGAYPGIDAEERGQAEAIAFNLREMSSLGVSTIVVIIGEGGSGGALAIGIGNRVLMMENAVYSVISPEGCAAILWKDASEAKKAAHSLRLTAPDLKRLGLVDEIVPEESEWLVENLTPVNGENEEVIRDPVTENLREVLLGHLAELDKLSPAERKLQRQQKFRAMGDWLSKSV